MGGLVVWEAKLTLHAPSTPLAFPKWMHRQLVGYAVKQAVQAYLNSVNSPGPSRQVIERCLAACRLLDDLSDEDWDVLEPLLIEEIAVLHNARISA